VHMPAHVTFHWRLRGCDQANEQAAKSNRAYIRRRGVQGIYPDDVITSHNLHFVAMCGSMNGRYAEARKNADLLAANVGPHGEGDAAARGFHDHSHGGGSSFPSLERNSEDAGARPAMKATTGFWHFARGVALAGTGKVSEAEAEVTRLFLTPRRRLLLTKSSTHPSTTRPRTFWMIAKDVLGAKIAVAKKDTNVAIAQLPGSCRDPGHAQVRRTA